MYPRPKEAEESHVLLDFCEKARCKRVEVIEVDVFDTAGRF